MCQGVLDVREFIASNRVKAAGGASRTQFQSFEFARWGCWAIAVLTDNWLPCGLLHRHYLHLVYMISHVITSSMLIFLGPNFRRWNHMNSRGRWSDANFCFIPYWTYLPTFHVRWNQQRSHPLLRSLRLPLELLAKCRWWKGRRRKLMRCSMVRLETPSGGFMKKVQMLR